MIFFRFVRFVLAMPYSSVFDNSWVLCYVLECNISTFTYQAGGNIINSEKNAVELNKESLADQVFSVIRDRIINLEISPGERIDVDELTKELEVSKAPIRDAMKALEDRGLVSVEPRVGYYARKLDSDDIEEIYDMRELFEIYAVEEAINSVPDKLIENCRSETEEIRANNLSPQKKREWFDRTDEMLHQEIILGHSDNSFLKDFTTRIHDLISITRHLNERISQSMDEHLKILDALNEGDENKAKESLKRHLQQVRKETLRVIKRKQQF